MKILSLNVGNARRDNANGYSLFRRFPIIVNLINKHDPDYVCLSEAARPSIDDIDNPVTWTDYFIPEMENLTKLKFVKMIKNSDTDPSSFGICFFTKLPETVKSCDRHVICDGILGNICMTITLDFGDDELTFTNTHLHVASAERFEGLTNILAKNTDLIFGDFNAFPDDNADEMCNKIAQHKYEILTKRRPTFISFPHDFINEHPKIEYSHATSEGKCLAFTPLDYVLKKTNDGYSSNVDILHPITGEIIKEDDDCNNILKNVIDNDIKNPYNGRCSDHLALLITVSKK
jgi:endonuclease/exonuclease/phosphatase family metal-dependent hydrolase